MNLSPAHQQRFMRIRRKYTKKERILEGTDNFIIFIAYTMTNDIRRMSYQKNPFFF